LLILLDFSNAFNTVDFDILLVIMSSINISPTAIDWFQSYLFGRRQRTRIDNFYSSWCDTSAGVPQGGVLSPLLFAIFINTISKQLTSSYHLYADDLQIYVQGPVSQLNSSINKINADLARVCRWGMSYGLSVNPSQTQFIAIGSPHMIAKIDWSTIGYFYRFHTLLEIPDSRNKPQSL
jgi:hypothetical protein